MTDDRVQHSAESRRDEMFVFLTVTLIAFLIFLMTCFRTVTWWDSINYTVAAHSLGVPAPPGSLLAVMVGWLVTQFTPVAYEAFALNLLAALLGALTAGMVFRVGMRLVHQGTDSVHPILACALGTGALVLAFGDTLWLHATKFTPYIFTAFLTAVIMWLLLRWWQEAERPGAWRALVVVAFLLSLDFSIHRTNLLLIPGIFLSVVLCRPKVLPRARTALFSLFAFAVGLAFHLLLIPIAARHPFMNFNDPSTLGRFWDYISLKQFGGGWLLNILPRKAPFWDYQIADYFKVFETNFSYVIGKTGLPGLLPAILGVLGIGMLFRRNWRLALSLVGLFFCAAFGAILYFNIPADFFRPFDRHYLPSLVIFAVFILYGLSVVAGAVEYIIRNRAMASFLVLALALVLPVSQLMRNYYARDASRNRFEYDYATNILATLPPNAILFTFGDMDTYAPWYLQSVEGQRPDVTVINTWLLNTPWYIEQLRLQDSLLPLTVAAEDIQSLQDKEVSDTVITVSSEDGASSVEFHVSPSMDKKHLVGHEWAILNIITNNHFRRPIYFSSGGGGNNPPWTAPHLAFEGLAFRLVPGTEVQPDLAVLAGNIFERYRFTGYNDSSIAIDEASMSSAPMFWQMFYHYAMLAKNTPGYAEYAARRSEFLALMPPKRFVFPEQMRQMITAIEQGQI